MIPKFRAWLKDTKQMIDVQFLDLSHKVLIGKHWEFGMTEAIKFDDVNLMQSTGLMNKIGIEIFEGDVIDYNRNIYVVVKIDGSLGLAFFKNGDKTSFKPLIEDMVNFDRLEVIGNIYENPELLEG